MSGTKNEEKLLDYLKFAGILLCNVNTFLPSLSDVGGEWNDIVSLMEKREAFYCKVYRKRVTYLSKEVYFLLKQCRERPPLHSGNLTLYDFLKVNGPADTETLKQAGLLEKKEFAKSFDFLLENRYITMVKNREIINENWSTFIWGVAEEWEKDVRYVIPSNDDAEEHLRTILLNTMQETEVDKLIGRRPI